MVVVVVEVLCVSVVGGRGFIDEDPCGRSGADARDICGEEEDDALEAAWTSDDSPMMGGSSKSPEWLAASMVGPPRDPKLNGALDESDRGLAASLTRVRRGMEDGGEGPVWRRFVRPQFLLAVGTYKGRELMYSAAGGGIAENAKSQFVSFGRCRVKLRKVGIGIGWSGLWINSPTKPHSTILTNEGAVRWCGQGSFFHSFLAGQTGRDSRVQEGREGQGGQGGRGVRRVQGEATGSSRTGIVREREGMGMGTWRVAVASLTSRAVVYSCIRAFARLSHLPAQQLLLQWCMA